MKHNLTDGQRFRRAVENDARVRSKSPTRKVSQHEFEHRYAQTEHESVPNRQKTATRKSAKLLAVEIDETTSFAERSRFVVDHGTAQIKDALLEDQISFQEAWKLSRKEREIKRLQGPASPNTTVGAVLAQVAAEANSIFPGTSRWSEAQRDIVAEISTKLAVSGLISETELDAILAGCFRRKTRILGGSLMSAPPEAPYAP